MRCSLPLGSSWRNSIRRPRPWPGRTAPTRAPADVACRVVTAPIMPGAEPWSAEGGPDGVLVLHGFTGNPQSMRPLAEALAAAGFTVDLPLLPGPRHRGRGHGPDAVGGLVGCGRGPLPGAGRPVRPRRRGRAVHGRAPWPAGWPSATPTWPASPWSTRWSHAPGADLRSASGRCSTPASRRADGIGSDIKKEGAVEAGLRRARRWPPSCRCSRGPTRSRPGSADIHCPVLLLSSREDHVVDAGLGRRSSSRVQRPGRAGLARGQLPRGHPGQRRAADRVPGGGLRHRRAASPADARLMAEPARLDPRGRGPRGRPGPPRPERGGARPVHRPAGRGARPRRRRGLPRPGRRGARRPTPWP